MSRKEIVHVFKRTRKYRIATTIKKKYSWCHSI